MNKLPAFEPRWTRSEARLKAKSHPDAGASMVGMYILFGGAMATFVCISVFFVVFIARGAKYKERSDPDYYRITLANPLTALFIDRFLTHEGLKFRSVLCKTPVGLCGAVLLAGIAASEIK
jgi:hypothetical protein